MTRVTLTHHAYETVKRLALTWAEPGEVEQVAARLMGEAEFVGHGYGRATVYRHRLAQLIVEKHSGGFHLLTVLPPGWPLRLEPNPPASPEALTRLRERFRTGARAA